MDDERSEPTGWGGSSAAGAPPPSGPPYTATATDEPPPPPPLKGTGRSSALRSTIEWVVIIGVALVGAVIIRTVLFQAFFIPSESMIPTLKVHDRILVNKLSYDFHGVHRGDIVVFRNTNLRGIGAESNVKDLVKRVVGLPGDTIESTPDGHVEIDGVILSEPYLPSDTPTNGITRMVIPPHHYFVMGDNRTNSSDSRVFGPIDKSLIVGRAFMLIWPIPDMSLL